MASTNERADLNGARSFAKLVKYAFEHELLPREEIISTLRNNGMGWIVSRIQPEPAAEVDAGGDN
jgi:hypothetical protein